MMTVMDRIKAFIVIVILIIITFSISMYSSNYMARVSGTSMMDTYYNGDIVIGQKNPSINDLHDNDVIVFKDNNDWTHNNNEYLIKRIIAEPGDTVAIDKDGRIHVNGKLVVNEDKYTEGCKALESLTDNDNTTSNQTNNTDSTTKTAKTNNNAVITDGMGSMVKDPIHGYTMKFTIPDGMLFVRGDNLNVSSDSRYMYCNEAGRLKTQGFLVNSNSNSVSLKVKHDVQIGKFFNIFE